MWRKFRVFGAIACVTAASACVSATQYNTAMTKLDSDWKKENDGTFESGGRRMVDIDWYDAFLAVQAAFRRLGMVVEQQDLDTGFIFATAPAPVPLTAEEWRQVQDADTSEMRTIIQPEVGLAGWFATLDPSGKDVLVNAFLTDRPEGVEIALGMRLLLDKKMEDGRAKRTQAPPTAVRIGLEKFWRAFDREVAHVAVNGAPPPEIVKAVLRPSARATMAPSRRDQPSPSAASASGLPKGAPQFDDIAVIVANGRYRELGTDLPDITPAYADADGIRRYVGATLGVSEDNVIFLRDAKRADLIAVFGGKTDHRGQLFDWVEPGRSRVFVYYAGHGAFAGEAGGEVLVPVDAKASDIERGGYALETLYRNLARLPARSVTVVLEAGFSGESQTGTLTAGARERRMAEVPANLTVISASGADQIASWEKDRSESLFTKYFLSGVSGEADAKPYGNGDGKVGWSELKRYLKRTMTPAARDYYGREQSARFVLATQG